MRKQIVSLTYSPAHIGSDRTRMAADSRAVNIRHSVNIHLNCIPSVLVVRYSFANIDQLVQPIGRNCRYHDAHNNYLIDVVLGVLHCDSYCCSWVAVSVHG